MKPWERQDGFDVRLEWGVVGALALSGEADIAVVIDVLSFTTTVSVALDLGTEVLPFPWRDNRADSFAAENGAVLAVGRGQAGQSGISLSPSTLMRGKVPRRLVLPSPNGSTVSHALGAAGVVVVAASLRNASAVAEWLNRRGGVVALLPAGERWPDGSLRPAIEDLWGAGAVAAKLGGSLSPEAAAAAAAWNATRLPEDLFACASGRELTDSGWHQDVATASDVDISQCVPVLADGAFIAV